MEKVEKSKFYYFKHNKLINLIFIFGIYLLSIGLSCLSFLLIDQIGFILSLALADLISTVIVWLFGLFFDCASIYDPYWSVIPPIYLLITMYYYNSYYIINYIVIIIVLLWSIRLTYNWANCFKYLAEQDWRYTMIHDFCPKLWYLTSFLAIDLYPTCLVFALLMPGIDFVIHAKEFNLYYIIIIILMISFIGIELLSDYQLTKFRKSNPGLCINKGIWQYSRHPNYFGEIGFWWCIYFLCLINNTKHWYYLIGALWNTLSFTFVSIPMMENHIIKKQPLYKEYKRKTSMIIPLPNFPVNNSTNETLLKN